MGTIAKVTAGGATHLIASTVYGICSTAANTAAKTVSFTDDQAFTLIQGETIHVKFTNSNTAANPTLNVKGTGAKPIYRVSTTRPGTTTADSWVAGEIVSFTYDTTATSTGAWIMNAGHEYTASTTSIVPVTLTKTKLGETSSDLTSLGSVEIFYEALSGDDPDDLTWEINTTTVTNYSLNLGNVITNITTPNNLPVSGISGLTSNGQSVVTGISAS